MVISRKSFLVFFSIFAISHSVFAGNISGIKAINLIRVINTIKEGLGSNHEYSIYLQSLLAKGNIRMKDKFDSFDETEGEAHFSLFNPCEGTLGPWIELKSIFLGEELFKIDDREFWMLLGTLMHEGLHIHELSFDPTIGLLTYDYLKNFIPYPAGSSIQPIKAYLSLSTEQIHRIYSYIKLRMIQQIFNSLVFSSFPLLSSPRGIDEIEEAYDSFLKEHQNTLTIEGKVQAIKAWDNVRWELEQKWKVPIPTKFPEKLDENIYYSEISYINFENSASDFLKALGIDDVQLLKLKVLLAGLSVHLDKYFKP